MTTIKEKDVTLDDAKVVLIGISSSEKSLDDM